jgi:UDPglucose 6-dehydrogenase
VLPPADNMRYAEDAYAAAANADAVLILTDWKQFATLDLARLNRVVHFPIVIDGRNLYKPREMENGGFTYVSMGRQATNQALEEKPKANSLSA